MEPKKENLLNKTYSDFLDLMLHDYPVDKASEIVVDDVTGYGTTVDEKINEIQRLKKVITDQRDQGDGITINWKQIPVHRRISPGEDISIYTDEFTVSMKLEEGEHIIPLRLSSIFEFLNNSWKLVHIHGSVGVVTEQSDTWHKEEWKKKNEELQKLVEEKTADLEKKNRELEIEAALERVRAKAMAMRSSEDLGLTVDTFFSELKDLNVLPHRCGLGIIDKESKIVSIQAIDTNGGKNIKKVSGNLKLTGHPVLDKIFENWQLQEEYHPVLRGKEIMEYYNVMNPQVKFHEFADDEVQYGYYFYFKEGGVYAWTDSELPERDLQIFRRYSSVLSLTYRRYLDLKDAEDQALEAKIEASLERLRSRTNAMHESSELSEVAILMNKELRNLGFPELFESGFMNMEEDGHLQKGWMSNSEGKVMDTFALPLKGDKILDERYSAWKKQQKLLKQVVGGRQLHNHIHFCQPTLGSDQVWEQVNKFFGDPTYFYHSYFEHGGISVISIEELSPEQEALITRFTAVFKQTYTRFLDLKKAEQQAGETLKQASLDRIRGHISSMRKTEDLQQITPLIWRELKTLDVPFFRCGVFILDDPKKHIKAYLATPEGKSLGALDLDYRMNGLTRSVVDGWQKKEVFQTHWSRDEFIAWTEEMMKLRQIEKPEDYQGAEAPPDSLYLHFIPFAQGMLYVGNIQKLENDKIDLVKSLADAFSLAYARYEDFVILEEAKEKVEKTLRDLKATQSQLIHAEKMASLGELTAGIAHEIQNPLNFVNNFSEVSADLIQELTEEMENGETDEVFAIAADLRQNLEKINHHGKRASNIVKGMLQHSRNNPGEKSPTDINALADEYLRLAYHGLRAKDKSFNAEFRVEADADLPEIEVVPQDIGRVLLNLINNAFYAVRERAMSDLPEYKPMVTVRTKKLNGKVEVSIIDNGKGIADSVKEKIFQPFFTTKPTGEGTGLGLSMSYDIITKGHGGELIVDSEVDKGTEFIIILDSYK